MSTESMTSTLSSTASSTELSRPATERGPDIPEYGPHNPRRSKRGPKLLMRFSPSHGISRLVGEVLWVKLAAPPVLDLAQPCLPVNLDLRGIELMDCVQY